MTKRRLIIMLAVVAMAMAVMGPATAGKGGITAGDLEARGYFCFDNSGEGGAGTHCTKDVEDIDELLDYITGDPTTENIHVMVFSPDGNTFYGPELLGFDKDGNWFGKHAWKAGICRAHCD